MSWSMVKVAAVFLYMYQRSGPKVGVALAGVTAEPVFLWSTANAPLSIIFSPPIPPPVALAPRFAMSLALLI